MTFLITICHYTTWILPLTCILAYFQASFYASQNWRKKIHPLVPPLDYFEGEKNCSSFARTISTSKRSFFANLATFERRSGLKQFFLLKIAILKMGGLSKVIGPEEMPILVWGGRKRPQLTWDQPKTYKCWQSPHFQNPNRFKMSKNKFQKFFFEPFPKAHGNQEKQAGMSKFLVHPFFSFFRDKL